MFSRILCPTGLVGRRRALFRCSGWEYGMSGMQQTRVGKATNMITSLCLLRQVSGTCRSSVHSSIVMDWPVIGWFIKDLGAWCAIWPRLPQRSRAAVWIRGLRCGAIWDQRGTHPPVGGRIHAPVTASAMGAKRPKLVDSVSEKVEKEPKKHDVDVINIFIFITIIDQHHHPPIRIWRSVSHLNSTDM